MWAKFKNVMFFRKKNTFQVNEKNSAIIVIYENSKNWVHVNTSPKVSAEFEEDQSC
jgi:hypothetical protein